MPAKKGGKDDKKKGGKAEPEKPKEEEKKGGKDDKKGGGKDDKGKGGKDDKKGGKDDKKGGKDDKKGGKGGKDDKKGGKGKGKKEESEEEEEMSEEEELSEEEEDSEDDPRAKGKGKGKGKGKPDPKAKGKGKGKSRGDSEEEDSEEEDEDEEEEESEEEDRKKKAKGKDVKGKGGKEDPKKAKAKGKPAPPPGPDLKKVEKLKRGLKNTSKLFMRFSGFKRRRNSRKKLKSTSRLFLGLGKRKNKIAKKKRRKSLIKHNMRFMMRFRKNKDKDKKKDGNKSSYMLLRLDSKRRRPWLARQSDGTVNLKNPSTLLGKIAGATNWLTKRFLSTKQRQRLGGGRGGRGFGMGGGRGFRGRQGSRRPQMSMGSSFGSRQTSMRGFQNPAFLPDDFGAAAAMGFRPERGSVRRRRGPPQQIDPYGGDPYAADPYGDPYADLYADPYGQTVEQYDPSLDQGYYEQDEGFYDPGVGYDDPYLDAYGADPYLEPYDPYAAQDGGLYQDEMGYEDGYEDAMYAGAEDEYGDFYGNGGEFYDDDGQMGYYDDMQGGGGGMYDPYGEMMMMGDPYAEEYPDPYGADPYAADPYAMDPYAMDPYAMDPYAMDPYAMDPYAMDPYAQAAAGGFADPYTQVAPGGFADPYGQAALAAAGPGFGGDPYGMPAPGGLDPYVPDFAFSYSEGGGEGPLQSGFGGDMGGMGAGGMSVMGMGAGGMGAMGMGAGGMGAMGMGAGGMGAMGMGTGGMGAMGMGGAMGAMGMGGAMGAMGMGGAMGAMGMGGGMGAMGMGGMGMGAPAAAPMVGDGFEEFGGYGSPEVSGMEFRVPRPQVKLFGKERMDVALPPPPNLDQYQAMALAAPFSPTMGGFPPQQDMMSAATGAFPPQPYSPTGPPMVPTPTAMLIKTANQPGASPLLGRRSLSPQRMSPVPQAAQMMGGFAPAPLPSPTPSRRSMAMMGMGAPPMGADPRMSPLPARRPSPMGSPLPQHRGMPPMAMGHVPGAPQPPLSPRAVRRSPRHGPPSPRRSPSPTRRLQPQPSFQERPMPAAAPMPGRMGSRPPSLARTSPPASPRGSFRRPSPPTSPRASMRQASPPPGARRPSPPLSPSRPFGARKMPPGASSPPRSPSPTLSRRGFAPVPPRAGPRSSSPTLSRRSTRLAHDPLPLQGSPGGRGRGRGRGIPMGAVRPLGHRTSVRSRQSLMMGDPGASPVMARGGSPHRPLPMSPGGPRSGQRPVGRGRPLMAGARHSGMSFGSPQPVKRGMMPPSSPQPSVRHFSRPTSPLPQMRRQGHPMAMSPGGMSMGMAGMGMAAPGMAAPMAAAAPMAGLPPEMYPMDPMGMGMGMGGLPPQVSPPMMGVPPQALDPASAMMGVPQGGVLSPSPPMMAAALSGSPLSPAQLAQLPADIFSGAQYLPEPDMLAAAQVLPGQPEMELSGAFPPMAGSPMLSSAMQNQQIRGAAYGAGRLQPLAQMPTDPQDPMNPMLASALQNPQLMGASFGASPLGMPGLQDPYAAAAAAAAADPYSSPQLSAALQSNPQLRQASYGMAPLQRPQSPYSPSVITHQYQEPGPGPALHSAIQNPALQNASYRSHLRRRGSQRSAHSAYSAPRSPHLGRALQNPYAQQASAYRLPDGTFYDSRKSPTPSAHSQQFSAAMRHRQHLAQASYRLPDGTLVGPQMTGPVDVDPTSPMLANALQQNQALRGASYRLPDGTFISSDPRYAQQQMTSPQLSRALQNPNLRAASYRLPDGTLVMGGEPQQPQVPSPNLAAALQQNPALRLASYTLPDGSVITVDPRTGKPTNPNLSTALQNELLRAASYRLPDGSIIDPRTGKPTNPNLSLALQNELLRGAAYRLPDGSLFSAQPKSTSPNLSAALQNEMLKGATYRLPDGSVISAYPKPTSPNLAGALQNEMMKAAKYRLPDGSIISAYPKPTSPNLAAALQNEMMKAASYRLPDGSLISAYPRPAQPNLSSALQNEMMKAANYRLPDGSLLYPKPAAPNLMGALRNEALKSATYRLPDGSLISACPQRNPDLAAAIQNEMLKGVRMRLPDNSLISLRYKHGPKVSSALLNQGLRGANFRLNQSSVLAKGFQANPYISDAMENLQVKGASFQLPSGLTTRTSTGEIIGPEGRYQVVGPRGRAADDHWARHARAGQTPEEVWASERVLPHGTVQNLSKWSMYRDEGMLESLGPPPMTWLGEREGEVPWVPEREEGEPTGPWFDKIYFIRSLPTMRYRVRREVDGIEDMTQLDELCEASVLKNLRSRYERELIYTYIGSILISVNPYQLYNIYGTDAVLQYEGHGPGDNPPHIFAIANTAYTTMMDAKKNQCVIISGESGSGKTEATKLVLRYLTAIHHKRNITQQIEILEATPLLESFGNAKTVRNDNSSRFGKFVEIFMEEGVISGAITSQYLLEKSRIVFQAKDERNYHIFYEMLAGLPSNLRQSFYLQEAETYYYLNQGGNCVIQGKDDGDDFRRLVVAMEILSFSPDDQNNIFRVLASILHLGNVFFHRVEVGGQEGAGVVSAQEIRVVAELLHISPEGLQKALTYKVTDAMREKIYTPLTVESAVDARDAVAKILYSLLFHWLTERINGRVYPRHEAPSIAILDIYGFEDLLFNSFEQLCINYANETLQAYFTRIIFRQEQEEYFREQISWSELSFTDNQSCIDLIVAKPHGILRILDDQNGFPQATDHTFLQKCHYHHGDNELYMRPKMPQPEFTIKHYAGRVTYQVQKFLDKNYDQLRQEVLDLFVQSRNTMVGNLFQKHADSLGQQRGAVFSSRGSSHTRKQTHTVAAKFQHSLQELLDKMERCSPYFVRCVKPNQTKDPGYFDMELVATQLRYLGILDTIRIRKEGYPIRIQFFTFLHRYKSLLGLKDAPSPPDGEQCVLMLRKLCPLRKGSYQVGVTKIFLKEELYALLESKRERMLHLAALILQRCIRMHFARVKFVRLRLTMIKLQARCRGYMGRMFYLQMRVNLIRFRSLVQLCANRQRYMRANIRQKRMAEQARLNREVINLSQLPVPAELAALLHHTAVGRQVHAECLALVESPRAEGAPQLTLPHDINNYLMTKYIRTHFRELKFGMLIVPLENSLTRLEEDLRRDSLDAFTLILRFMGDPNLNGAQENLFGNYIIQRGLAKPPIREEILAQLANQVWRNERDVNAERGWLLLATCLSAFYPTDNMAKYLLKFVSDYALNGYKALCQHKLLQALQKAPLGPGGSRCYPPSLLEWTAARKKAHMLLLIHCTDGFSTLCPVHSWSSGEEVASSVLEQRGVASLGRRGWSLRLQEAGHWVEIGGHDYLLDAVSQMELPPVFPSQRSFFLISTDQFTQPRPNASMSLFGGFDGEEEGLKRGSAMTTSTLPIAGGHYTQESGGERGMDNYLDSLFDPVLSDGTGDMEASSLTNRMRGAGGVGVVNGDSAPPVANVPYSPPGAVRVLPTMPVVPNVPVAQPVPDSQQDVLAQQQQAIINQQAVIMAQQMTMQAMAMVSSPPMSPPMSPPPTSPPPVMYGIPVIPPSPYAQFPPSPYAAPQQHTHPATNNTHTNTNTVTHTQPASTHTSSRNNAETNAGSSTVPQVLPRRPSEVGKPASANLNRDGKPAKKFAPVAVSGPMRAAPPGGEVVKSSVLRSEHIVPSHNIKDIIRQYQTPPAPPQQIRRREGGRGFQMKKNPHAEAMQILKPQIDNPPAPQRRAPAPTAVPRQTTPNQTIRKSKPRQAPPPAPLPEVSRELPVETESIQTLLHRSSSDQHYTYSNVPWKIYLRKEIFYPKDNLNNPLVLDLIFKQVVVDTFSEACVRITKEERQKMKDLFGKHGIKPNVAVSDEGIKKTVVALARESWEIYFSRLFPASGSVGTGVQVLAVSDSGVKLLKTVKTSTAAPDYFKVLRPYSYTDIMFVTVPSEHMLEFNLQSEKLILFTPRATHIKQLIDHFISQLKKDSDYVVAERNVMNEDRALLSFHKGDIIRLQAKDGLDPGQSYGCVVKKKVMYLEELKRDTADFGWRFGALLGRSGAFPSDAALPVSAPDFLSMPAWRGAEPQNQQGGVATSGAVALAITSSMAAHTLDPALQSEADWLDPEAEERLLQDSQYNIQEFAKKYFRQGDSRRGKDFKDPLEMLKFSKSPITESLIDFTDPNMNRVASEIFLAIMKFMGDQPLKGQSDQFVLGTFLKLVGEYGLMRDEAYCQVLKQITSNTSAKPESCQKGWRLLYILTAFYSCSVVLRPFMLHFLLQASRGPTNIFQGIAKACEQNLRKTFQFGGRRVHPNNMELKAIMAGRSSKRQLFLFPGGIERHLKVKTCSVAMDIIEELCYEMAVQRMEAMDEYTIFIVTNRGQSVRPLTKREYILDVGLEAEQSDPEYTFCFRRVIWSHLLTFDNELSVTLHFNQVLPDYLKGLLNVIPTGRASEQQLNQVAKLAALQHRSKECLYTPTAHEVAEYIPAQLFVKQGPKEWHTLVSQHTHATQALSTHQARAQFLGLVCAFPMFGSSFFYIISSSNPSVSAPCILAVNQNGLHFLHKDTHELLVRFPLKQVQATHTQRPSSGHTHSYPYVDILIGDLNTQRVTQLQLEQGLELCRVIAMHVENLLSVREKRLTLPPSEITLL